MKKNLQKKLLRLRAILSKMQSVLVAYSGGVDSSFLLKVAKDVLGRNTLAVTAKSPLYPEDEIEQARKLAKKLGVRHIIINTNELKNPDFVRNPVNRCYLCKKELFKELTKIAKKNNLNFIADGSNFDDNKDYRPGSIAVKEFGVRSPLKDAKFSKRDIRELSKNFRLSTWDKPAFACLASRFPYEKNIDRSALRKIEEAEKIIKGSGFNLVRVRHHGNLAKIEIPYPEISKIIRCRERLVKEIKKLGYNYVCLDLQGYRSGSLNEALVE